MTDKVDKTKFADEYRKQRHEFILQYYDMAQKDLERHLKLGWETIATAAGAVTLLSVGQQGYLPVPIAVTIAITVCFWGIWNVIDAAYWATRAIAFLANVEALYFYKEDSQYFNPYAGSHPRLQLMDSLKAQFVAVVTVVIMASIFLLFHVGQRADGISNINQALMKSSSFRVFLWFLPGYFLAGGIFYAVHLWRSRITDYRDFVKDSPGPGMLKNRSDYRILAPGLDKDGNLITELPEIISGEEIQRARLKELEKAVKRWDTIRKAALIILPAIVVLSFIWLLLKPSLYGSCFSCFR